MMAGSGNRNGNQNKNPSRGNQSHGSNESDGVSSVNKHIMLPATKNSATNEIFEVEDKATASIIAEYRDFSRDRPDVSSNRSALGREGAAQTFPMKLHSILSNPEFSDIISWLPHGRAWRILQTKAFEERAIPLYFRHGRYSSFARQVNGWGFRRITHGPDYNSYYHEMFLKGLPHLCDKMKRLTSKDVKKLLKDDAILPDFYALSREFPLPDTPVDQLATSVQLQAANNKTESVADSIRSLTEPFVNSADASNPKDTFGPIASLLSSFGVATQSQQQIGQDSQASMLGAIAAIDNWSNQSIAKGAVSEPPSLETRRNDLLQRMMQIASTAGSTSQLPVNETNLDLNSQLISLLTGGVNTLSNPLSLGVNLAGQPTATVTPSVSNALGSDMLAMLGQQVLNPALAASLAQMVSNASPRTANATKNPSQTFAMPVATPSAVIVGASGSSGIDLSSFLLQQKPAANNSTDNSNVLDLASLIRMSQSPGLSHVSSRAKPQLALNSGLPTNQTHWVASAVPDNTGVKAPQNPHPQVLDLSSFLRVPQQQAALTAPMAAAINNDNSNVGVDFNTLALLLHPNNASNLRIPVQATASQQQSGVLQPSMLNRLSTLVEGNKMIGRQQYPNSGVESNSNTTSGIEIQCLQQLLGHQTTTNSAASSPSSQNVNQLEAALKLLINNASQGNANPNGGGSDTNINIFLAGLQR